MIRWELSRAVSPFGPGSINTYEPMCCRIALGYCTSEAKIIWYSQFEIKCCTWTSWLFAFRGCFSWVLVVGLSHRMISWNLKLCSVIELGILAVTFQSSKYCMGVGVSLQFRSPCIQATYNSSSHLRIESCGGLSSEKLEGGLFHKWGK